MYNIAIVGATGNVGRKHRPHHADRPFFQRGHPGPGR